MNNSNCCRKSFIIETNIICSGCKKNKCKSIGCNNTNITEGVCKNHIDRVIVYNYKFSKYMKK